MSNLLLTLIIAFVVIALAIACLAIGWLITGKSKIVPGACGRDPEKLRDETGDIKNPCSICNTEEKQTNKSNKSSENPS